MTGLMLRRQRGLTLVEVMVALSILSLVILTLAASLRGVSSVSERLDRFTSRGDEVDVAVGLLRELFERWEPVRTGRADAPWLFDARADAVAWVATMPARFGAAGPHAFRLGLEGDAGGPRSLVLRFAPLSPGADDFPDWTKAESRVLVSEVVTMALAYGGAGLSEGWRPERPSKEGAPPRLRVDLGTAAGPLPPLVFIVRTSDDPGRRATFGGRP